MKKNKEIEIIDLEENKEYKIGDFTFKSIFTPGHSKDSVTFYFEEEKQKLLAPEKLWVYENHDMFSRIELIVGQGNIAYKR